MTNNRATLKTATALLAMGLTAAIVLAQAGATNPPPTAQAEAVLTPVAIAPTNGTAFVGLEPVADTVPGSESIVTTRQNRISVTLNDVPLADVVRMFTRISGANIIATSSNLQGMVTANLTDVEWYPAMLTILKEHSLTLNKAPDAEIYSIVRTPPDAPEPLIVKTIFMDYATVNDILVVVKSILLPQGMVSGFPSRNAIVVRSTAANLGEVEAVLKIIDIQSKQVCIETRFMQLTDNASKKLGIRWDSLEEFGVKLGAGPFSTETVTTRTKSRKNNLERVNNRSRTDTDTDTFDMFDVQKDTGIAPHPRQIVDTLTQSENASTTVLDDFNKVITEQQAAILDINALELVLSALRKTEGVSVISNPKIIVNNGSTNAYISIGDREPIVKTSLTTGTQNSPGDKLQYELDTSINTDYIKQGYLQTGMDLRVMPTVKTDDLIEAIIAPSLRRKLRDKVVGDNSWPIISVKEIRTQFTLRSGQTVAIGGLTDTSDTKKIAKIPVLGSIPLIGKYLFSHEEDAQTQEETIIFVTLSLAPPDALFEEAGIPKNSRLVHEHMINDKKTDQPQVQIDQDVIKATVGKEVSKE